MVAALGRGPAPELRTRVGRSKDLVKLYSSGAVRTPLCTGASTDPSCFALDHLLCTLHYILSRANYNSQWWPN